MPKHLRKSSDRMNRKRRLFVERLESRALMAVDGSVGMRHNLLNPSDVNMDGTASPLDALIVIDELNRTERTSGQTALTMSDTNNDGFVSPLDALVVIDTLNAEFRRSLPNVNLPGGWKNGMGEGSMDEVVAVDDEQVYLVPSDATVKPDIEIDVLMNDMGEGLKIVAVGQAATGTVSIRPSSLNPANVVLVYTPNASSAYYDRFMYMIESSDGRRSSAFASVLYEQASDMATQYDFVMPEQVEGSAGKEIVFRDADANPLIQLDYKGSPGANAGVYLSWAFAEGFSVGQRFVGDLLSRSSTEMATIYPVGGGNAWIYGDIAGVNRILANLYYKPAEGYSSSEGVRLNGWAFFYSNLLIKIGTTNDSTLVKVTQDPSGAYPRAVDDFFSSVSREEDVYLDILANDDLKAFVGNPADIDVELTPWEHSDATLRWDPVTRRVIYRAGFLGAYKVRAGDQFAYTLRTPEGLASQGIVTLIHEGAL